MILKDLKTKLAVELFMNRITKPPETDRDAAAALDRETAEAYVTTSFLIGVLSGGVVMTVVAALSFIFGR